jgi:hypothetical protein
MQKQFRAAGKPGSESRAAEAREVNAVFAQKQEVAS